MKLQANKLFKSKYRMTYLKGEYENIIRYNSAAGIDKMTKAHFDKNLDEHLNVINRKVLSGNYKFTYYKEKLFIKNRNSKPRMISIPTLRDRVVLKILHGILQDVFDIKTPLVQSVIHSIKTSIVNYDSFIKIDVTNFFGSLDHEILFKKLHKSIRKKEIKNIIHEAITNPTVGDNHSRAEKSIRNKKGVPQGIPIANVLAEIYLKDFDEKYKKRRNIRFFRYVDDILILCNKTEIEEIKREIISEIEDVYKLKVNSDKSISGELEYGFSFLGYSLSKESTNKVLCTVKKSSKIKFEKSIVDIFSKYSKLVLKMSPKEFVFYLNLKITGSIVKKELNNFETNKKYGWLFFYSQIEDMKLLYHLDNLVKKFIEKYGLEKNLKDLEIKSFVKSFYEITQRRSSSKYIFKPDELSLEEKKFLLIETFNIPIRKLNTEEDIERFFGYKVRKQIKKLEEDIQNIS